MPSILTDDEKQTVKRTVPKASNKIHAVAVAKLYIAHPSSRGQWTSTGLSGAAVLANDLVGHTFWLKLVDLSAASRGVLWDQEIYDSFQYNQDRVFFFSFEGEECMFGLSFADEKEAKQFRKKMEEREKNAHKNTKGRPFAHGPAQSGYGGGGQQQQQQQVGGGKSSRFGGLFGGNRHSTAQQQGPAQSIIPPRGVEINSNASAGGSPAGGRSRASSASGIDLSDPAVQAVLQDLKQMGITEDQIEEHAGFIKSYLEQNKATAAAEANQKQRAPPPPPPPGVNGGAGLSPQNTGSSTGTSRRGPPPAPPPSRRAAPSAQRPPSPSPSPPRAPSPPQPRFRVPPPLVDAGKLANSNGPPSLPGRDRAASQSTPGPPPPPRPPKTALDDDSPVSTPTKHAVPPAFSGSRIPSGPPPPPARNTPSAAGLPPPPPPRDSMAPIGIPPPPPPRASPNTDAGGFQTDSAPPPPPPLPPSSARPVPPPPSANDGPPPPPPLPPPNSSSGGPPPPPPMPPRGAGGIPDAPPPPKLPSGPAPARDGLLADIRGGARLKKVSDAEKRDRSAAAVPGAEPSAPPPPPASGGAAGGGDAQGGLAGALASALAARKSKVGKDSDDEKDDDDW